jgi:hypothetical protein
MCHIYSPIQDFHMLVIVMNCGFYSLKIKMRVLADYAGECLRMENKERIGERKDKTKQKWPACEKTEKQNCSKRRPNATRKSSNKKRKPDNGKIRDLDEKRPRNVLYAMTNRVESLVR